MLVDRKVAQDFATSLKRFLGPCVDCGATHNLSWDHVAGSKKGSVGFFASKGDVDGLVAEAQKCVVRCLWCHDRAEYERGRDGPLEGRTFIAEGGLTCWVKMRREPHGVRGSTRGGRRPARAGPTASRTGTTAAPRGAPSSAPTGRSSASTAAATAGSAASAGGPGRRE